MTRKTKKRKSFVKKNKGKKIPHNKKQTKRNACECLFGGGK